ncbi:ribonuclease R [Lachnoclostridium phytofermentans]|uniref:Ribonuclease R n=1 Tax=Lachnoclostridium phytofermentans (strain ATCC 700394 / DSM 18823 / ISDg) TaxID=357809 RepID=A9KPF2_LACP7|nr:ribonuclease R [Lachnoclostridium phytofermentans]ABX43226.1 ribonuclease R [Lachnoclostridium phytofermentans ISDg]
MEKEILNNKKELLLQVITDRSYRPMKFRELSSLLQVPKDERDDLKIVMDSLISDGKIMLDGNGRYKETNGNIKTGIFSGTTRGFGFVKIEGEENEEDIFIPESETKGALNKDRVQIAIFEEQSGRRREGAVISILERNVTELVGTFQKSKNFGFVIADNTKFNSDVFIPKEHTKGAVNGHKVLVQLTDYGSETKNPEGKIIKIIGHINDPGVDVVSVILENGLPTEFPDEVMKQVERIGEEVSSADIGGRVDLRNLQTVTIDGEDAKDLDDAITLSKKGDIYQLGVHIADVSNYVTEDSPLDKEALKRGTSVYLVDRVIPMLPHKLSNGICSLNAGSDRLALSCMMEIDEKGNVVGHRIAETVINVDRRMTYTSVKKIIEDHDEAEIEEYKELVPMFELMLELADILREKRRKRGSIDFDFPESKIILDSDGRPTDIKPYERNKATKIIEDFMLIANETVAEDFFWQELPFVYRTHENPDLEKIQKLSVFINNFGYTMRIGQDEIHPKELQKLLIKIDGKPEEALISRLTLRSMKQAKYTTTCDGHFGLSTKYYSHFTSPIRRYPDLQIHRIIKENLRGGLKEKRINHYESILNEVARQSSLAERRADESEREVEKLKKVEYMSQFIGQTFEGVISGVTSWGMYVELPNTVEGMIRLADMHDDYYIYDEEHYLLTGEHTKKIYKLGEAVVIRVEDTDKLMRTINFSIVGRANRIEE